MFDPKAVFEEEFTAAVQIQEVESGFPVAEWFGSGPSKPEHDIEVWYDRGPECIQRFIDWYEASGASVWRAPNGDLAIEPDWMAYFGDIPVPIRPDAVFVLGSALVVYDCKTGAKVPATVRQLGIYASGIELMFGIRPKYGAYFMARGTGRRDTPPDERLYFQRPVPLDGPHLSIPYLTKQFEMFVAAREQGLFIASPGEDCKRCGVNHACLEMGGKIERKK